MRDRKWDVQGDRCLVVMLGVFVAFGVFVMGGWGVVVHAHDDQEVARPPRYAPPPPPLEPAPQQQVQGCPTPCQPPRVRRRATPNGRAVMVLGESRVWLQPSMSHIQIDLQVYRVEAEVIADKRYGLTMGGSFDAVTFRFERWFDQAKGDFGLQAMEVVPFSFRVGGRHWYIDSTMIGYRRVAWALPEAQRKRIWLSAGWKGEAPEELVATAPMYLTPGVRMGLRFGKFSFDAGIALLDWNLGSYRATARWLLQGGGLSASLETVWQQDQLDMQMKSDGDKTENASVGALWQRATWDTQLLLSIDFFRLVAPHLRRRLGPLHGLLGVQHRYNLGNSVTDRHGASVFKEPAGSQWSVTLGLKLAFGYNAR